jgi:hypothetical protein
MTYESRLTELSNKLHSGAKMDFAVEFHSICSQLFSSIYPNSKLELPKEMVASWFPSDSQLQESYMGPSTLDFYIRLAVKNAKRTMAQQEEFEYQTQQIWHHDKGPSSGVVVVLFFVFGILYIFLLFIKSIAETKRLTE